MATTTPSIPAGTWQLDPAHSAVTFTVRHMMVAKVARPVQRLQRRHRHRRGPAAVDGRTPPCRWPRSTPATSDRDDHLRTNDFFDIENHPTMTFRSTGLEGSGDEYKLHGDLTIRGVTKPVTFDLEVGGVGKDPWGNTKAGFTATGTINRKDFGVEWNAPLETGGVLVGDKVTIELDIEATQPG